jgi:hypothetical protein
MVKEFVTIGHAVALVAGGLLHKGGQWVIAEYKKAKAAEAKVVADVKKDI